MEEGEVFALLFPPSLVLRDIIFACFVRKSENGQSLC